METRHTIVLFPEDLAQVRYIETAANLVGAGYRPGGGRDWDRRKRKEDREPWEQDAALLSKFSSNSRPEFTFEEALAVVALIERCAKERLASLNEPIFLDANLQEVFASGVRANAEHAVRLARTFMEDLRIDLSVHAQAA